MKRNSSFAQKTQGLNFDLIMAVQTSFSLNFLTIIFSIFLLSVSRGNLVHAVEENDILCLKSIKDSVEDPHNFLSSWDFRNQTKELGFICSFAGVECWNERENRVISLDLRSFGLKGNFPNEISYCKSLTSLDLSHNHFYGSIPANISSMLPFLVTLSLSSNNFSGQIPASLGNCSYLNGLELDHNRFSGQIPSTIGFLHRINRFNVAYNLLVGPVPRFVNGIRVNASSYANNPGLCGYPLKPCKSY